MNNHPTPDWDPRDISVLGDQRRVYDEMRERCPVAYSKFLDWSLFRHQDIINVLADPETYSSASKRRAVPNGMDPPDHTLYNRALAPYFQPEQMNALEPGCRRIAIDLLEEILAHGRDEVDFIPEFAQPFPIRTLCLFLGWPQGTWENLRGWTHGNQEVAFSQNREAGAALAREFTGYVMEALRVRREDGGHAIGDMTETKQSKQAWHGTDVTTSIMGITVGGVALSDEDIVSVLRNWTAGQGTVAASIGILVYYLAMHTNMQERLRSEPALLPAAIDEICAPTARWWPIAGARREQWRSRAARSTLGSIFRSTGSPRTVMHARLTIPMQCAWTVTPQTTFCSERVFTIAWVLPWLASKCGSPWKSFWRIQP